jgi:hypothetical protein
MQESSDRGGCQVRKSVLFVAATVAAILAVAGWSYLKGQPPAGRPAGKVVSHTPAQRPQDVIRYWTPERMRQAKGA